MLKKIIIISLATSFSILNPANADTVFKYGLQKPKKDEGLGTTKSLFVSYQDRFVGPLIEQYEFGYWGDSAGGGRRSSFLGSYSLGVNVNAGYMFFQSLIGPSLISAPDTLLGGPFQFNNDIAIGVKDPQMGTSFGVSYKHVSSAGLESPNAGRDFIMFRIGIPW